MAFETKYEKWSEIEALRLKLERERLRAPERPPAQTEDDEARVRSEMEEALARRFTRREG